MPYVPVDDIKAKIVYYLEHSLNSKKFKLENLTLESIKANVKEFPEKNLMRALKELEDAQEIFKAQSNVNIYIPKGMNENEKLIPFKIGNRLERITLIYLLGIAVFSTLFFISKPFQRLILSGIDFSTPQNMILNSFVLGTLFPIALGSISYVLYEKVQKTFYKIKDDTNTKKLTIVVLAVVSSLLVYVVLSVILKTQLTPTGIMTSIGVGIALVGMLAAIKFLKSKKEINKEGE